MRNNKQKIGYKFKKEENIYNIPNPITLSRIIISPFLIYLAFAGEPLWIIAMVFILAAFTDFLDGFLARKLKQETHLGRKLDIIADRILMISLVVTLFVYMNLNNFLNNKNIIFILLLMTREILCAPFFLIALVLGKRPLPHARFAGKLTTTFQGIGFPMVILNWNIGTYLAIATSVAGIFCFFYYIYDSIINPNNEFQRKMDKYYEKL